MNAAIEILRGDGVYEREYNSPDMLRISRPLFTTLALSLALTSVLACKSEVDDKPKAKVEAAENKADDKSEDKAAEAAGAKTLALVADASKVGFIGAKVTGDHKGSFETISGSATVEGDKVTGLELTIEVGSVKTDADPDLGDHLKGSHFFDAEKFPQATFTLLSVEAKAGEGGATHEVAGNLEIRGKANKVTFPATLTVSEGGVVGKAEFSINRKDWDIVYAGKPDNLIKDDVALTLDLSFE